MTIDHDKDTKSAENEMHKIKEDEIQRVKENEGKDKEKDKTFKAEGVHVPQSVIKQPIKFVSRKSTEMPVHPFTTDSKSTEPKSTRNKKH